MICPCCEEETPVILLCDYGDGRGLLPMCRHCKERRAQAKLPLVFRCSGCGAPFPTVEEALIHKLDCRKEAVA